MELAASPARTTISPTLDLKALASMHQFGRVLVGAEDADEPILQGCFLVATALMLRDDVVLAPFERMIEFRHDTDVARDELARSQGLFRGDLQVDQNQPDAALTGRTLDLGETIGCRGVDSGHQLEVEDQETALRMPRQKRLDVLVQTIGGAEEQSSFAGSGPGCCRHAPREHRQLLTGAIERTAVFRTVETEFDRNRCAKRSRQTSHSR